MLANHTLMALVMMWRCLEYGRYTRNPKTSAMCAQRKNHAKNDRQPSLIHVNRCETAVEIGVHAEGYTTSPSAMRAPRSRNSVRMIHVIRPRIRNASSRCEPTNRSGRWTTRIHTAIPIPTSTRAANTSWSSPSQPA